MEAAFVMSMLFFLIIVLIDLTQVVYAKLQLSAAVHVGSTYAMTGYSFNPGAPVPEVPEVAVSQKTAPSGTNVQLILAQCYVCDNGTDNLTCVSTNSACAGHLLFAMNTLTANYAVPLFLNYPGLSNPLFLSESVYYPDALGVQ